MRSLEAQSLRLVRRVQVGLHPRFALGMLRAAEVDGILAKINTVEMVVPDAHRAQWTPPLDGVNRLLIPAGVAFTPRRFAALVAACIHELHGEPHVCAYVAAVCGVINLEELQLKGRPFLLRKQASLRGDPRVWDDLSPDHVLRLARRVSQRLSEQPVPSLGGKRSAQYLLELGRTARKHDRRTVALRRLEKAFRLADAAGDWETGGMARVNIGIVQRTSGDTDTARATLECAARYAILHGVHEVAGCAYHDLFACAVDGEEYEAANAYAVAALEYYCPDSARRAALVYDVAHSWLEQGHAGEAMLALRALRQMMLEPEQRALLAAAMARAAAAMRDTVAYECLWPEAAALVPSIPPVQAIQVCHELALAHALAGHSSLAEDSIDRCLSLCGGRGTWAERLRHTKGLIARTAISPAVPQHPAPVRLAERLVAGLPG